MATAKIISHRTMLDNIITNIFKGKKFNGSEIRFIPFKQEKLKESLKYATYIMQPSREWLDKHCDMIASYKHTLKNGGFRSNLLSTSSFILSKEEAEEKLNNLLQNFQKVFPFLLCMDGRDTAYFWNYITDSIYQNSFYRQYKLME